MPISGKGGEDVSYGTVWGTGSSQRVQSTKSVRGRVLGDRRNSMENGWPQQVSRGSNKR